MGDHYQQFQNGERVGKFKKKINNKTAGGNGEDASDPNDAKVRKELMGLFPWITFCNYAAKFSIIVLRSTRRAKKIKNG